MFQEDFIFKAKTIGNYLLILPVLMEQRQKDSCKFKTRLSHMANSKLVGAKCQDSLEREKPVLFHLLGLFLE